MFFYREQLPKVRTQIVAEIGNIHDGSLGNCHALIDAVADAGADAVKFQCHIAYAESSDKEQFPARFQFHPQDRSRRDYWERMEFREEQWLGLQGHAKRRGLSFIVSPFSLQAVERVGHLVDMWKIASGEVDNGALIHACKMAGRPIIISSGMSTEKDLDRIMADLQGVDHTNLYLLQCTTEYPTPAEHIGMNLVFQWSRNLGFHGGLSDHSGEIWPSVVAAYLGAAMIEVHVCWDKRQFGADAKSSLSIDQFSEMVKGVRFAELMRDNPVEKDKLTASLTDTQVYREGKRRESFDVYAEIVRCADGR